MAEIKQKIIDIFSCGVNRKSTLSQQVIELHNLGKLINADTPISIGSVTIKGELVLAFRESILTKMNEIQKE